MVIRDFGGTYLRQLQRKKYREFSAVTKKVVHTNPQREPDEPDFLTSGTHGHNLNIAMSLQGNLYKAELE
jgi:hypothetical protein